MNLPRLLIVLSVTFTLSSATSSPHNSRVTAPKQYVEIKRPPDTTFIPACTLPVLSHDFGDTTGLPPTYAPYAPPVGCTWSRAAIKLSATANGTQNNRIAAVWLDGVEILRTSTPLPAIGDSFWVVEKDVTRYSSLLRRTNLTLAVSLPNVVDAVFTGFYHFNLTFHYYRNPTSTNVVNLPLPLLPQADESTLEKYGEIPRISDNKKHSPNPFHSPADLIIPISDLAGDGFWFKIETGSDVKQKGVQFPLNAYRAVIELYISFHANDEFWYTNPPDAYLQSNNLASDRGNGAYRVVSVTIDNTTVGSVIPFPVIFTGGINPLFWNPVVSIGAFDLPSYDIELTPLLGLLIDGKVHNFGLQVTDALSFWLVDANLHLWVDENVVRVHAKTVESKTPELSVKRKTKFSNLDGKFKIKAKRKSEFSGWVSTSFGNFSTSVVEKLEFKNKLKLEESGTVKSVEQEVEVETELEVETCSGNDVYSITVKRNYPLEITSTHVAGSGEGNYSVVTELETSIEEEREEEGLSDDSSSSSLTNTQKAYGTVYANNRVVVSGTAKTRQKYSVSDEFGCYRRRVSASDGYIISDSKSVTCSSSSDSDE